MTGQTSFKAEISNVTNSKPCVVTTSEDHGYSTNDFVRITDLNGMIPVQRGQDQINNKRFKIIVTGDTTFKLLDPITFIEIDTSTYPTYVDGGYCNKISTNFEYLA